MDEVRRQVAANPTVMTICSTTLVVTPMFHAYFKPPTGRGGEYYVKILEIVQLSLHILIE